MPGARRRVAPRSAEYLPAVGAGKSNTWLPASTNSRNRSAHSPLTLNFLCEIEPTTAVPCLLSVSTSVPAKAEAMADRLAQVSGHVTNAYGRGLLAGEVAIITGEYILNPRLAALWAGWRCRALYTTIVAFIKPYTRYIS